MGFMKAIEGIIFDYGGTIDSRGVHWSEVIWQAYCQAFERHLDLRVEKAVFRDAYVAAERELARVRHIVPSDNFHDLLRKKMVIEVDWLVANNHIDPLEAEKTSLATQVADLCYQATRECIDEAMPVLETLHGRYPMMLVSNFYGNIDEVLRDFGLRHLFKGIIESAVVGVRKPNPTLFRLGVDALELRPEQVLVVGDSLTKDILPAESLGCHTLWLKGKGWTDDEDAIERPGIITNLSQVLDALAV